MTLFARATTFIVLMSLSTFAFGDQFSDIDLTVYFDTQMFGIQDSDDLVIFTPYCEYEGNIFSGDIEELWLGFTAAISF